MFLSISIAEVKSIIKKRLKEKWQIQFKNSNSKQEKSNGFAGFKGKGEKIRNARRKMRDEMIQGLG